MRIKPNSSIDIDGVKMNIHFLQETNEEYDAIHSYVLESVVNGFENRIIKNVSSDDLNLKFSDK